MVSQHALQVSRPTPRGKLRGLACGGSPGPHPGGKLRGLAWAPRGEVEGSGLGELQAHTQRGISRPTPGGGLQAHTQGSPQVGIPACTEADTPLPADGYCCGWYASYWNASLFYALLSGNAFQRNHPITSNDR